MLERTVAYPNSHAPFARRLHTRSFRAWSGAALSRYFCKSNRSEPQPKSARGQKEQSGSSSDQEISKRRDQLQVLLQRVDAERVNRQNKTD